MPKRKIQENAKGPAKKTKTTPKKNKKSGDGDGEGEAVTYTRVHQGAELGLAVQPSLTLILLISFPSSSHFVNLRFTPPNSPAVSPAVVAQLEPTAQPFQLQE
ncbi:hypothetical protein SNOG_16071 [Parastagonospora nodorum SN15]|uniref:Uncharacterized protein n=1 Tax=Phaeosphaeria nodorum (strain SN15 / ATCC MYA-4574 / FGSC 10173) TaxID=321614 RepID=Q0TWZ5_PHANO|nr:hypothetical protein SNOG_16071 [Parastagonospora nodorum SN15]EAT76650.1 hypothetical protein SNOG_16071 [Parastagonospora nodorum SN15]